MRTLRFHDDKTPAEAPGDILEVENGYKGTLSHPGETVLGVPMHQSAKSNARSNLFGGTMILICCAISPVHASGLAGSQSAPIVIRGSSTLLPVVEIWASEFQLISPASVFDIEASGSSEGIEDLLSGRADIAMASRPITAEELSIAQRTGMGLRETVVARMGIAVVVNRDNPVSSVTVEKLADVFSGEIRNWREIGGPDEQITVIRKTSGWSPDFFRQRIMGDKVFVVEGVIVDSKEEVVAEVARRTWSIGVSGMPEAMPSLDKINLLRLTSENSDEDSTYALSRPLFFYTAEDSSLLAPFLEFVMTSTAQEQIVETGIYPAGQTDAMEKN